jgi:ABC-type phosphate transport system permease subunit
VALRAGPAVPSIAICVAALGIVATDPRIADATRQHPIVSAAVALAALNLPIMSARFRTVFRSVPVVWRIAAAASGATPGLAFWRIVLPRAWHGIVAVLPRGEVRCWVRPPCAIV